MADPQVQLRFIPLGEGAELRAEPEGEGHRIHGVAVPWEKLSVELWRDYATGKPVVERFARGAFSKVLASNPDVIVVRDHDRGRLLGRTASGTARVYETDRGLEYDCVLPDTELGRETLVLVGRGDIAGSSFAFIESKVTHEETSKQIVRTVEEVRLLEDVSPVTRPAYPRSAVEARALSEMQAELERWRGADTGADELRRRRAELIFRGL